MKSTMTPAVPWTSVCRLLALFLVLLGGTSAFAQSSSTNVLTSPSADLQSALDGGGTVVLDFNGTVTANGTFYISTDAVLDGSTNNVIISGGGSTPVFEVAPGVTFEVRNLTISGGRNAGGNGVNGNPGSNGGNSGGGGGNGTAGVGMQGGAVYNQGTNRYINCLFLTNTVVGGNGGSGGGGGNGTYYPGNGGNGGNGGAAFGGAIYNLNTLLLSNCTFAGNSAIGGNGGTGGTNGSSSGGGTAYPGTGGTGGAAAGAALYNAANARVMILACTFADNFSQGGSSQAAGAPNNQNGQQGPAGASAYGGGIYNASSNMIVNCTFYGNLAIGGNGGNGGNAGPSGFNQGKGGNGGNALGGGIYNASTGLTAITNCTFVGGQVIGGTNGVNGSGPDSPGTGSPGTANGANIYNANSSGTFILKNSILAYPTNAANSYGPITDKGYNLSTDGTPTLSPATNNNVVNMYLGTFANHGGQTFTVNIAGNSPAKDAIYDNSAPAFDQRGYNRPIGPRSDIGAFEFGTPEYSVSGNVGTATGNIVVYAQGTNGYVTVLTDSGGNFVFTNLTAGTYNIIPVATNQFNFSPTSQTITVPPNVTQVIFSASGAYDVGGVISNAATSITVFIYTTTNGNSTYLTQTTTGTNNFYIFTNLPAGNYTIVPNTPTYGYVPASLGVTLPPGTTNENFTAVPPTYTVSGQVTGVTSPVSLVATLGTSGTVFASTVSDGSGNYTFPPLSAGSYTITPQPTNGYTYTPGNFSLTLPPSTNSLDFSATQSAVTYSVNGQIVNLRQVSKVTAVSSASTNTVSTDANGNYSFSSLATGNYTIAPQALSGMTFNPGSIHLALSSSQSGQNFTAITTSHSAITSADIVGGDFTLAISGTPNVVYRIQYTTNVETGPWLDLSTNTAGADGNISITNSMTNYPSLYYRVVTP